MESQNRNEKLRNDIEVIINQGIDKASTSNAIMERLRGESIFIQKDYFSEFVEGKSTTINPNDEKVKFILDRDKDNIDEYEQLYANSFGPFNPEKYFESKPKIIIVDWEPYMLEGDLEKYRTGQIDKLGGRNQSEDFPTYNSLEAPTLWKAVNLCQMLLSRQSVEKTEDEVMRDHMCILEHNFFPALAIAENKSSEQKYIKKFAELNKDILIRLLEFYDGDIIIGCRDLLGYLCSYSGLFNVALTDGNSMSEGESTSLLMNSYPDASVVGRKVVRSWFNHQLGGKGASALLDDSGTFWIGYVHSESRRGDQWTPTDQENLASWIHRIISD